MPSLFVMESFVGGKSKRISRLQFTDHEPRVATVLAAKPETPRDWLAAITPSVGLPSRRLTIPRTDDPNVITLTLRAAIFLIHLGFNHFHHDEGKRSLQ